jgi:putative transposase
VKRSTLVDGRGVPLAVAVEGANVPDQKLVAETLDAIPIERPEPAAQTPQNLCLDKGYAGEPVDREIRERGYTPHVPRKANEPPKPRHRGQARRWKVERTHSWLNRARRLLIRWEKKVANYLGFLHLQFAIVTLRTAGVLG